MIDLLISYHWIGTKGKIVTVYEPNKVPPKIPYIIRIMEDMTKYICVITIKIGDSDIFDVLVTDDNKEDNAENRITFMMLAMLRLATKMKGER